MAAQDFDSLCSRLYEDIRDKLCRKEDEARRFAIRGTAKTVLRPSKLLAFFHIVGGAGSHRWPGLGDDEFLHRIEKRDLYDFLAVLIFASCNIAEARAFVDKLVAEEEWSEADRERCRLPASRRSLLAIFGNEVTADKFYGKQAFFSAIVLRKGEEVRIDDASVVRLPIISETYKGGGAFGQVYAVVVAPGHVWDAKGAPGYKYNFGTVDMARKDYTKSDDFPRAGHEEHEVLMSIFEGGRSQHPNIVENWGSLSIGPDMYSLFMPLASYDLEDWMRVKHPLQPTTYQAKADVLAGAVGLAAGLEFLHSGIPTVRFERVVCYHMDLKPDNVLVFLEEGGGPPVWKISDFNMSRIKTTARGAAGEGRDGGGVSEGRNFNQWFVPRQRRNRKGKDADPAAEVSATINRAGDGAYVAPEAVSQLPSMTTRSDVWSLACVLSVVLSYLDGGAESIANYVARRREYRNADGLERFFVRGKFAPSRLSPVVARWHSQLARNAAARDPDEGRLLGRLLADLERGALAVDQSQRCDAAAVRAMLGTARDGYEALRDRAGERTSSVDGPPGPAADVDEAPEDAVPRAQEVERWNVSSAENYKGCDISPDGTLVAYWTDKTISLYTAESLRQRTIQPVPAYTLGQSDGTEPDSRRIWTSVSLTQRYLVASVNSNAFKCYIFDLRRGRTGDASLTRPEVVTDPALPEIQSLALSPDSRTLVCVLGQASDDRALGQLFHTDHIPSLMEKGGPPAGAAAASRGRRLVRLGWAARDVVSLSVSDGQDVHLVIRPELTARSREHKVPIIHVSLTRSTLKTLNIESLGFDSSSAVGFFTAFLPLRPSPTDSNLAARGAGPPPPLAVLVTREKRLHLQAFPGANGASARNEQCDVKGYRLLQLLAATEDVVHALGTRAVGQRVLLLELTLVRPQGAGRGARIDRVEELLPLPGLAYGDKFVARLAQAPRHRRPTLTRQELEARGGDGEGDVAEPESHLLIATLATPGGRRSIFRVALEGTGMEYAA